MGSLDSTLPDIDPSKLIFEPVKSLRPLTNTGDVSNYMLEVDWTVAGGWGAPKISARRPLTLDPASGVVQYAITCFEGMKAYKSDDDRALFFRPDMNMKRFQRSCHRLGLPSDFSHAAVIELLTKLIGLETEYIPKGDGLNLYLRPTMIDTTTSMGLSSPVAAKMFCICQLNVGSVLWGPEKSLKLFAQSDYIRAWKKGTGAFKLGANYGPTIAASVPGYTMSLWLHSEELGEKDLISEAGGCNVFVAFAQTDGVIEVATMSLENGLVLPGVTRDSALILLRDHESGKKIIPGLEDAKIKVSERDISMREVVEAHQNQTIVGIWGMGTAVVVTPVSLINYQGKDYTFAINAPVITSLQQTIMGIQRGRIASEWSVEIPKWSGN